MDKLEKPTVSLCMIVKNESELLSLCLESVQGIVDEIIVVDTGSTDNTKEIALTHGAKVFDFPWVHDFSAARNYAMEQATSDWILQLDADEHLTENSRSLLLPTVEHVMNYAINIQIKNLNEVTQNYVLHQYPRLYRNVPEIRYKNRIHEQLVYDGESMEVGQSDIQIIHLGYTEQLVKKKNKTARNVRLLQEELKLQPENGFMHFNLGNEYMKTEDRKKALKHYQIAHKNALNTTVQAASALQIVKILFHSKQYTQGFAILREIKALYPDYTDIWYLEAETLEMVGQEEEAKDGFLTCLQKGEAPKKYLAIAGVGSFYPIHRLANLALLNRRFEEALGYLTEMTELNKYSYHHVEQIMGVLIPMFGKEKVIEFIHETYPSESEKDLVFKTRLAHAFRLYAEFSLLFPKTMEHFTKEEQALLTFYLGIGEKEGKEQALAFAKQAHVRHFALLYYLLTQDTDVKEALMCDKTCAFIIMQLAGENPYPKKNNYKKELYVQTLHELMKIEQYALVEALVPLALFFEPHAFADIGDLFVLYQQDDLAIEYYTKYLMKNKHDFAVYLKTARLLYHQNLFEEAMLFAEHAHKLQPAHFKPMEILLESSEKLALADATKQLANAFLQTYPESTYLQQKAN